LQFPQKNDDLGPAVTYPYQDTHFFEETGEVYPLLSFTAKEKAQKGSLKQNKETKKVTKKIERITDKLLALYSNLDIYDMMSKNHSYVI
jgi:hypothetical protein